MCGLLSAATLAFPVAQGYYGNNMYGSPGFGQGFNPGLMNPGLMNGGMPFNPMMYNMQPQQQQQPDIIGTFMHAITSPIATMFRATTNMFNPRQHSHGLMQQVMTQNQYLTQMLAQQGMNGQGMYPGAMGMNGMNGMNQMNHMNGNPMGMNGMSPTGMTPTPGMGPGMGPAAGAMMPGAPGMGPGMDPSMADPSQAMGGDMTQGMMQQ